MALQHTRLISKVFSSRVTLASFSKRNASTESGSGGAPYRPYPAAKYQWAESANYWSANGYKPTSAEDDEYESEEVYLSEIEERLKKYDAKYCDSDRVKALYNEFGWEAIDDRATYNYGGSLGGNQYGEGKKLDPSHYVTPEWTHVNRKALSTHSQSIYANMRSLTIYPYAQTQHSSDSVHDSRSNPKITRYVGISP